MRRTNIYLGDEQLVILKHLATEEDRSVAELVRQAVDELISERLSRSTEWGSRFDLAVERLRSRLPVNVPPDEIENDITAARAEVKADRARRR